MSRRERIARSTKRLKAARRPDVADIESMFPNPPRFGEAPVTDIEDTSAEVPEPGPDHANPAPQTKPEVHRRDRERRPIRPEWTKDPVGHIKWEAGYAAHRAGFHVVRVPWYLTQLAVWSPRGLGRLYERLYRFGVDEEARPLRAAHVDARETADFLDLRDLAARRGRVAVALGVLLTAAVAAVLFVPLPPLQRAVVLLAAVLVLGYQGRPLDRPAVPSAVVAAPKYKRVTPDQILRGLHAAGLCKPSDDPAEVFDFETPGVHRDGDGWAAVVALPPGYTADQAMGRRTKLAAGLKVDESRLFLSRVRGDRGHAGLLEIYIANKDPFGADPVPSPLTKARSWSLWKPIPFGRTARGKTISFLLVWTGVLIGAMPRQGKSFAARLLAAAAALDINARLIVFNGKHGKDWSALQEVAHRYGAGVRDHVVESLVQTLRECKEDVDRRYELLDTLSDEECPDGKVTPKLCERKDLDLPLVVVVIDEVQEYLDHEDHGKLIKSLLTKLAKLAPAVGYMVVLSTQKPDGDTIPTSLRDQLAARFCLKTANADASKTVLGKLGEGDPRPEDIDAAHKGTGVLLGADVDGLAGHGTLLIRTDKMDLVDLRKVCKRGRELREVSGTLTGYAAGDLPEEPIPNLFLEHVHAAMESTEDWVWSERVCSRLAETQPDLYDGWEPEDLGAALAKCKIATVYKGGQADGKRVTRKAVVRQDVIDALAERIGKAPESPADEGL